MCTRACPAACTRVSRAVGRLRQPLHTCAVVSRSHGLRMCEIHCTIVIFPADMRVSQASDWNTVESARVFVSVTLVVRVFGRTSVIRQSELRTDVR